MNIVRFFGRIPAFLREVKEELKKVSWSKRKDLIDATIVVLVGTALLTIFIAVCDTVLSRFLQVLIK
ncbi:MAG: preprotein translocase subunit SecE [Candidatus Omnitrophica bacterium]|nr:preprotein translocase subunit SecE [Candidatus Omnitrophota bacterium]